MVRQNFVGWTNPTKAILVSDCVVLMNVERISSESELNLICASVPGYASFCHPTLAVCFDGADANLEM